MSHFRVQVDLKGGDGIPQNTLSLTGRQKDIDKAHQHLLVLLGQLVVEEITLPRTVSERGILEVIKSRLDEVVRSFSSPSQSSLASALGVASADSGADGDDEQSSRARGFVDCDSGGSIVVVCVSGAIALFQKLKREILELMTFKQVVVTAAQAVLGSAADIATQHRLFSCIGDPETMTLTLSGKSSDVDAAAVYVKQLNKGVKVATRLVCFGVQCDGKEVSPGLIAAYFQLPLVNAELKTMCVHINRDFSSKGVTATPSSAKDGTLLVLIGPQEALDEAEKSAAEKLKCKFNDFALRFVDDLSDHDVKWLKQNASKFAEVNAVIRFADSSSPHTSPDHSPRIPSDRSPTGPVSQPVSQPVIRSSPSPLRVELEYQGLCISVALCDFMVAASSFNCDTIVNSANPLLSHGSGIARAIADVAGRGFSEDCARVLETRGVVAEGTSVVTGAHGLAQHGVARIVHTVVPRLAVKSPPSLLQQQTMRLAVESALTEAALAGAVRVAIPGLGTGVFNWSCEDSSREMVRAVREWVAKNRPSSIKAVLLFDKSEGVVDSLVRAAQDPAASESTSGAVPSAALAPPLAPGPQPVMPQFQWYWKVWPHEIKSVEGIVSVSVDGNATQMVPYDYDQVVDMERAFLAGAPTVTLLGDLVGVANGRQYSISFIEKTQTTIPIRNHLSVRPIVRLAVESPDNIPLFRERCAEHAAAARAFEESVARSHPRSESAARASRLESAGEGFIRSSPSRDRADDAVKGRIRIGVQIFANGSVLDSVEALIRLSLRDAVVTRYVDMHLLKRTGIRFEVVVDEVRRLVAKFDIKQVVGDDERWSVTVVGLGLLGVLSSELEVSRYKDEVIAEYDRVVFPASWVKTDGDPSEPVLVTVLPTEPDYEVAKACFLGGGFPAEVNRIERVQNVELYQLYWEKKREISKTRQGGANELLLKHGTKTTDPAAIWKSGSSTNSFGFDFRFSPKGYFGRGAYFAESASYSHGFTHKLGGGLCQMFLAHVAAGHIEQRDQKDESIVHPAAGSDSVRGPITSSEQGLIVYQLHQSYPSYLVTYKLSP